MRVDVMVPTFGDSTLLRETVGSVLGQDHPDWRLTVVDDGVADGRDGDLRGWLAGFGDERVRYLPNPVRLGINRNFQRCADEARAELVVILGSDDRLLPGFVRAALRAARAVPQAAFVHTGAAVIDEHGGRRLPPPDLVKRLTAPRVRNLRVMGGERLATSLLHGNWMYFPSVVFRREVLARHGFRPGYEIVQDLDLYLRILLAGGVAVLLERPCVEYRRHRASLSSVRARAGSRFAEELAYFTEVAGLMAAAGWSRAARAACWHWTSRLHTLATVPGVLAAGQRRVALSLLRTAAAVRPPGTPAPEGAP